MACAIAFESAGACWNCKQETKYRCLTCDVSTCNKSDNCSVYASEETPGWKAGASVAYCITCYKKEKHSCDTLRKESIVDRTAAGGKTQPVPRGEGPGDENLC